jgi:recombination protein RecR
MAGRTDVLGRLLDELEKLPGVGPKSAERFCDHILRSSQGEAFALAQAIREVKERLHPCSQCFSISEVDPCHVCRDPRRDRSVICVVEQPRDVLAIERAGAYRGLYHVLGGRLAPLEGVGVEQLTIKALLARVKEGTVREVVIATNPTAEGETTALALAELLKPLGVTVTRLARGMPAGASLETSSAAVVADALRDRRPL